MTEPYDAGKLAAEHLLVVLVEPQHPGNVGAAARAMKNMGLKKLVIANPPASFDTERARWMAPGADDVINQMRITATLSEALEGVQHVFATTARHRRHGQPVIEPPAVAQAVLDHAEVGHTSALLFGREDHGLSNEATLRAAALVRIATARHASLNLGQAVLLCAHEVFEAARSRGARAEGRLLAGGRKAKATATLAAKGRTATAVDVNALEPAIAEITGLLNRVGYGRGTSPDKVGVTLREALQRAALSDRHVSALRGMMARLQYALDHPEVDWQMSRRQREAVERAQAEAPPPNKA